MCKVNRCWIRNFDGLFDDVYTCTCSQIIISRSPNIFDYDTCQHFVQVPDYADEMCKYEVSRPIVGILCGCPEAQDDAEANKKLEEL